MVREDGVQVKFVISNGCWERFKAEISVNKPYLYKGLLSSEAENAFNHYIVHLRKIHSNMQHGTQQQHNDKKLDDLIELRDNIVEYMVSQTTYWPEGPRDRIIEKHLTEAVNSIRTATDKRVSKKWIDRLFRADLLRRTGIKEYQFWNPGKEEPYTIDTSLDRAFSTNRGSKVNEQPATVEK